MAIPKHWLYSGALALPGAVLYRALDSSWVEVESPTLKTVLTIVSLTLAFGGIGVFIVLSHASRVAQGRALAEKETGGPQG